MSRPEDEQVHQQKAQLLELHQIVRYAYVRGRDLDRALDRPLDAAFDVDRARARARALNPDINVDLELTHVLDCALELAHVLDRALDVDVYVDLGLDHARALDSALDCVLSLDLLAHDRGRVHSRVRALAQVLEGMERSLGGLQVQPLGLSERVPVLGGEAMLVRPGRAAVRVCGWATRMLPPPARARYGEELLDELYALAEEHAGWWRQVVCALRQLVPGVWRMRAALREERTATGAFGQGW